MNISLLNSAVLMMFLAGCAVIDTADEDTFKPSTAIYLCTGGETVSARYLSADTASVAYRGKSYDMRIAISASGARYVGSELEWWTKGIGAGAEGTLYQHNADNTTGATVAACVQK
ncbi:MAG: MliC family protein [Desulfopila sp.]